MAFLEKNQKRRSGKEGMFQSGNQVEFTALDQDVTDVGWVYHTL
jgi:hypothetical protein